MLDDVVANSSIGSSTTEKGDIKEQADGEINEQ